MTDPLLTSLCSICHTNPHKYRCPRCFVLTCSLPCIRRHKQWAQCSGLRDPAAYIGRADLATAKGIDHDYNYLTSLERVIDNADRNATERGIVLDEVAGGDKAAKGVAQKGEIPLKEALERCGVLVARAPRGMSRAKANQTRWVKKRHHVSWTVEWVHPDGRREEGECADDRAIGVVYGEAFGPKEEYRSRKRRKSAKERLRAVQKGPLDCGSEQRVQQEATSETTAAGNAKDPAANVEPPAAMESDRTEPPSRNAPLEESSSSASLPDSTRPAADQNISQPQSDPPASPLAALPQPPSPFVFYLHAPGLPSRHTVLIPLPSSATLASFLRDRLVLEFPTIYVFESGDQSSESSIVPAGFITQEAFLAQASKEKWLVEELEEGEVAEGDEGENGAVATKGAFDADKVLTVLGVDVKGLG